MTRFCVQILNWMQGKRPNGRKGSKRTTSNSIKGEQRHNSLYDDLLDDLSASNLKFFSQTDEMVQKTHPGEISNWPHVLLAIGTFGDENLNQAHRKRSQENPSSSLQQHLQDLTPEELNILHKEFNLLLDEHLKQSGPSLEFEVSKHCPSNIFLNRQLSFESEITKNELCYDELIKKSDSFQHVILSKGKDVGVEANDTTVIGKRTLSLLLKKIFVCGGGTATTPAAVAPPLRITTLESKMEKVESRTHVNAQILNHNFRNLILISVSECKQMLRIILQKKIYPQSSNVRTSSKKKYLRKKNKQKDENEDEKNDKTGGGSKWVQTDSEC